VQIFGRFLLACVTLMVLGAAGVAGASAFNERRIAATRAPQMPAVLTEMTTPPASDSMANASAPMTPPLTLSYAGDSGAATPADTGMRALRDTSAQTLLASAPPLAPIVPAGRHRLADSMFAVRTGDTVRVHFDNTRLRTRRADKLERIIRATLPEVYGKSADSVLAAVPAGQLVNSASLLTELPSRGLHFPLGGGWVIALWPETRPGQDGPLVVSYRTVVVLSQ
jgi:hypothetical protein